MRSSRYNNSPSPQNNNDINQNGVSGNSGLTAGIPTAQTAFAPVQEYAQHVIKSDPFENKITSTINAKKGKRMGCLIASFGFVGLLFGIAVSFGITFKGFYTNFSLTRNPYISDGYIQRAIQKEIQNTTLREYMEDLTRQSHFQGEQGEDWITRWIGAKFKKTIDRDEMSEMRVEKKCYTVLLSYPNENSENEVKLLDDQNNEIEVQRSNEPVFYDQERWSSDRGTYHRRPGNNGGGIDLQCGMGLGDRRGEIRGYAINQTYLTYLTRRISRGQVTPYSPYSPKANLDPTQFVYYAHYGTKEDFKTLLHAKYETSAAPAKPFSQQNALVIVRHGKISVSSKVINAQALGFKGLLVYTDPQDRDSNLRSSPRINRINSDSIRKETVLWDAASGDPLTPGFPSIPEVVNYRLEYRDPKNEEDATGQTAQDIRYVPGTTNLVVQPINYRRAKKIIDQLAQINGKDLEFGDGVRHTGGGDFKPNSDVKKVQMVVNNEFLDGRVENVLGIIRGGVEPDRYVIVGNHRDAWGRGAVDAASGLAAMVETARAMNKVQMRYGWRPRRTIIFASWGAGKMGNIGSNEWVEENLDKLKQRAVAYVNVADCVSGDVLEAEASFSLKSVVDRAMKNIPDPTETEYGSSRSYFDYFNNGGGMGGGWGQSWSGSTRQKFSHISDIQSEGDLHPFAFVAGVPSINLRFVKEQNNPTKVNLPLSDTQYDDMDHYWRIDPKFTFLQTCSRLLAETVRQLADSTLLPHYFEGYALAMENSVRALHQAYDGRFLNLTENEHRRPGENQATLNHHRPRAINLDGLSSVVKRFSVAARNWTEHVNRTVDLSNPISVRIANDQIMQLERIFLLPVGLPVRNSTRHALMATRSFTSTQESSKWFPGIHLLFQKLSDLDHITDSEKIYSTFSNREVDKFDAIREIREEMRRHMTDLIVIIHKAAIHLNEFHVF